MAEGGSLVSGAPLPVGRCCGGVVRPELVGVEERLSPVEEYSYMS